jgi:putative two-component system hydrogenase maturation factor HypX/HoxX
VWITHLKRRDTPEQTFFKLPATRALALARPEFDAPEVPVPIDAPLPAGDSFREIACWTYLLPRRVGAEMTARLTGPPFTSVGTRQAIEIGLLDAAFGATLDSFRSQVRGLAERLARNPDLGRWLEGKRRRRVRDEKIKPLNAYRKEELARSYRCFFGEDRSYHEARHRFVHKLGAPCAVTLTAAAPADAPRAAERAA